MSRQPEDLAETERWEAAMVESEKRGGGEIPEVLRAVVVGPDDHLLLTVAISTTDAQVEDFATQLSKRFGGRIAVVRGVEHVVVIKPGASHDAT